MWNAGDDPYVPHIYKASTLLCLARFNSSSDLFRSWKLASLELTVDYVSIMRHLKAAAAARDKGESLNICLVFIQKFLRQTDGCG